VPRWVVPALIALAALALVPFAYVARARASRSPVPRIHLFQDMDNQPRFKSQQANPLFADRRAMRPEVAGTVAHGELREDERLFRGVDGGQWVREFPVTVDRALLDRGRERYGIYCAPCHGLAGYGDGMVSRRADRLQEGAWVPPSSLHADTVRSRPVGHLFNTVTHGIRNMPAYGASIPVADRWAVVAWVRVLQRSQHATLADVPEKDRPGLAAGGAAEAP
jgi:mono/diheme cytochrome c family protein